MKLKSNRRSSQKWLLLLAAVRTSHVTLSLLSACALHATNFVSARNCWFLQQDGKAGVTDQITFCAVVFVPLHVRASYTLHTMVLIWVNYLARKQPLRAARNDRSGSWPRHAENIYLRFQFWTAKSCSRVHSVSYVNVLFVFHKEDYTFLQIIYVLRLNAF
jgi:hypothetical protein